MGILRSDRFAERSTSARAGSEAVAAGTPTGRPGGASLALDAHRH